MLRIFEKIVDNYKVDPGKLDYLVLRKGLLFGISLLDGFGEGVCEVLSDIRFEVIANPEQLLLLDGGGEMLIFDAPESDAGLGWGLHLRVFESKPHTAVYYRFGGLIDQCCEVISQLGIDDARKLIYGVLAKLLGSGHITQHLDGKPCSISDLGLPGIVEDPVVLKHELIIVVH